MIDPAKLLTEMSKPQAGPAGYTTEFDGEAGVINTPAFTGRAAEFDSILTEAGFDPDLFEIVGHPKVKTWDAQTPEGVRRLYSYGINVRRRASPDVNVDDLVAAIHAAPEAHHGDVSFDDRPTVFAVGDLQLGKSDGDGSEGIVKRFKRSVEAAVERYMEASTPNVVIVFLGDCVEGVVSQGGKNIANNDLSLTDQLRVLRHLMTFAILRFSEVCNSLTVASVPGNHDEAYRSPANAAPTDSFAVDSLRAVEEAFELAGSSVPAKVTFVYPKPSELTIAVDSHGHKFLLAHGHQWRTGKHFDWWKGMAFSGQTGADADYLLAGHRHHFEVDTESERFFIQVPAVESRSDWWRNKTGQTGNPGAVYLIPGDNGQPYQLAVL